MLSLRNKLGETAFGIFPRHNLNYNLRANKQNSFMNNLLQEMMKTLIANRSFRF